MQNRHVVMTSHVVPKTTSYLFMVLSFFVSSSVFAIENFRWTEGQGSYGTDVDNALANGGGSPNGTCTFTSISFSSSTNGFGDVINNHSVGVVSTCQNNNNFTLNPGSHIWTVIETICDPTDSFFDDVTHTCQLGEPPQLTCEDLEGQDATTAGYFFAKNFNTVNCHNGCVSIFTGTGPFTFPNSAEPTVAYQLGIYEYSIPGEECTSGDTNYPVFSQQPVDINPPDPDPEGNGNCPNGWHLQPDGSCSVNEDPSDPLNGGEAGRCPEGSYYVAELGICIGYNDPNGEPTSPSDPSDNNEPTGGGEGNEPDTGGNDGGGEGVNESGVDTDGDGETGDEGFCIQFPDSPICKVSSHVDKGCSQPPACSGDAIQCAIDKKLWQINCNAIEANKEPKRSDIESKLDSILGTENRTGADLEQDPIDLRDAIDRTSVYTSSCPAPYVMNIYGQSYSVDFSEWCTVLEIAGYLVILLGGMLSARIVVV